MDLAKDLVKDLAKSAIQKALAKTTEYFTGRSNYHFEAAIQEAVIRASRVVGKVRPGSGPTMKRLEEWATQHLAPESPSFPAELRKACLQGDATRAGTVLLPAFHGVRREKLSDELVADVEARLPKAFLAAFGETLTEKRHEKGLIAFQRECTQHLSQQIEELGGTALPEPPDEVVLSEGFLKVVREIDTEILDAVRETRILTQTVLDEQRAENDRAAARHRQFIEGQERIIEGQQRIEAHVAARSQRQTGERLKWTVPKPSAYLTGQDAYLDQLREALSRGETGGITQPTGLRGLGGIGKTEIALAYAHRSALEYEEAHFVVAESLASLDAGLARLMVRVGGEEPAGEQVAALKDQALRHLSGLGRALLVLDNVDDIVGKREFLDVLTGLGNTHVIVTCRHSDMGDRIRAVPIEKMDDETGALYVLRLGIGDEGSGPWVPDDFGAVEFAEAKGLSAELDGLPLALHHAGAMIRGESLSVKEARDAYAADRERLLKNRDECAGSTHPDSVWVTTQLAFEKLQQADPAAAELVVCCAFLAPEAMLEGLFTEQKVRMREPLKSSVGRFSRHRAAAIRSALIDRTQGEGRLAMHRVTQAVLQDLYRGEVKARWMEVGNEATVELLHAGKYREAVAQAETTLAGLRKGASPNDPDTLTSMSNLASAYWSMGRHAEALELQEETLRLRREVLGERHPDTLTSMNNLASTFGSMGRHAEDLELQEETLRLRREVLGERHPDTLTSKSNVALTFGSMGRYAEALELQEETLRQVREALGERHPNTLSSMGNLAQTYSSMGRYSEALELQEETLRLRRELQGERHPSTLRSMNNLAESYRSMGQYEEALAMHDDTWRLSRDVLGEKHPTTLASMGNLAATYGSMGRHAEALVLQEETLRLSREALGDRHPHTLSCMNNLAEAYRPLRRDADALKLNEDTMRLRRKVLGERHPDTLTSMNNLAHAYGAMGRHAEALELEKETLRISREVYGEQHPRTLTTMSNLAETYRIVGRHTEALELQEKTLLGKLEALGEWHPTTLTSMNNLGLTHWSMGNYSVALELQEQTLRRTRKVLGELHLDTLTSMRNVAITLADLGRADEAGALLEQVIEGIEQTLGRDHTYFRQASESLATIQRNKQANREGR